MDRLLTFNCHESYVHLLGKVGFALDIIDGLPGRYTTSWDTRMRPVPDNAELVTLEQALAPRAGVPYRAAIAHNLTDLLALRTLAVPKILVLHVSLRARILEEPKSPPASTLTEQLRQYLALIGGTAIAVSEMKRDSWGLDCEVIRPSADPAEYGDYDGREAKLLRVANQVAPRAVRFDWQSHTEIVQDLPILVLGHNPGLPHSRVSRDWQDTREVYRTHRAYVHTAGAGLDDGYNMGLVEAMLTGMPVLCTKGSESPVLNAVNGYSSNDPGELHRAAQALLDDLELCRTLGQNARQTALKQFSLSTFVQQWQRAVERAERGFRDGRG